MAVGQVSSITGDKWQLIATNTPTSGTSSSFTSLSGYKKYKLVWDSVIVSASSFYSLVVTFNGSTTKYAAGTSVFNDNSESNNSVSDVKIPLYPYTYNDTRTNGWLDIDNALEAIPKTVNGYGYGTNTGYLVRLEGGWYDTAAITSIAVSTWSGSATFTSGNIKLYGIAE